jgi:4-amino-4-deoxy-L-arabinose transferase-like glycosyltransferase
MTAPNDPSTLLPTTNDSPTAGGGTPPQVEPQLAVDTALGQPSAASTDDGGLDDEDEAEAASEPLVEAKEPRWVRYAGLIALAVALLFLCAPIGKGGIWDPFELNVADLSRRIAVNVYGAHALALDGVENSMPRLGDLGRGELSFDSIALGFRVFGLHEWSGRLPLALWGLAGVFSLYWLIARMFDRRAALYSAVILCTLPLYFVQARTMLGDIVLMSAVTMAIAGFGLATFARRGALLSQLGPIALGSAGLVAGFLSRGLLLGVALPALGVGVAWAVIWASDPERRPDWAADAVGAAVLLIGVVAGAVGSYALLRDDATGYSMLAGGQISNQSKFPTFDFVIHYLGHALFPWSAFIPFAIGRVFRAEPPTDDAAYDRRVASLRVLLIVSSAVAFGFHSLVAPKLGTTGFGAVAMLAAIAAVALRDLERGASSSRALGVGVALLTALYLRDYVMFPEKGLSAFAVSGATFPESFKARASSLVLLCSGIFAVVVFFAWLEEKNRPSFSRDEYLAWPRRLGRVWGGNLLRGLLAGELALLVVAVALYVGLRIVKASVVVQMGLQARLVLMNAFWVVPLLLFGSVWSIMALRDTFRWIFDRTGVSRAMATLLAGLVTGGLLSFVYYPALAAQLSPKEVFESYGRVHKADEPLALLGVGGKSASYYSGAELKTFSDVQSAFAWLTATPTRRFLAVRNEDLGRLNSLFRGRPGPKQNLPVLDARSSQILLVSNELLPGESNQNPYDGIVLEREPEVEHRVEVNLQDQLLSLGWDVSDAAGKRVDAVVPARKYHFRLYYKVLAPVSGEWETFIHIDGFHRRFNGDHKTLGGKYAFSLFQVGDYIVDDYEFSLEPNFTPGEYNVYYGLFVGETRMKVKTGRHDDNRIDGGLLKVQ